MGRLLKPETAKRRNLTSRRYSSTKYKVQSTQTRGLRLYFVLCISYLYFVLHTSYLCFVLRNSYFAFMRYQRYQPPAALANIIECYWIIEDADTVVRAQKIIPDGFTEIIFHYGDPFRININGHWQLQGNSLLAGQINKHFYLENTGASGILGIKLQPAGLTHLFNLSMHPFTNAVVDLHTVAVIKMDAIEKAVRSNMSPDEKIALLNTYFTSLLHQTPFVETPVDRALNLLMQQHGMVTVAALVQMAGVGERQLENLFKKWVGVSPKLFARIIRFSYIFQLVQDNQQSWCGLAYEAAFYDQSHFIRNFKNFTGENPSDYKFEEKNMANFFLSRPGLK